jgi:simple sugar transport system ATP-binding protein
MSMEAVVKDRQPILRVKDLHKHFGGLIAVDRLSMDIYAGEVLALVGDNGAGKSTLVKMVAGVHSPDGGSIYFDGREVAFRTPQDARRHGIETIHQDLALCENLDAAVNIFLGRELVRRLGIFRLIDRAQMVAESRAVLDQLAIYLPNLECPVRDLSGGQRQAVAIARAIYWKARLMIMDEPTAALGVAEQRKVLELARTLRDRGVSVVIVSHNMQDVFAVADRIVVMRRGKKVGERKVKETDADEVVGLMVGTSAGA